MNRFSFFQSWILLLLTIFLRCVSLRPPDKHLITLCRVDKDNVLLCGEIHIPSYNVIFATTIGKMKEGTCRELGYSTLHSIEQITMGPFGQVEVYIYTKH